MGFGNYILLGIALLCNSLLYLCVGVDADLGLHLGSEEQGPQVHMAPGILGLVADGLRFGHDVLGPMARGGRGLRGPDNCALLPLAFPVRSQMHTVPDENKSNK